MKNTNQKLIRMIILQRNSITTTTTTTNNSVDSTVIFPVYPLILQPKPVTISLEKLLSWVNN